MKQDKIHNRSDFMPKAKTGKNDFFKYGLRFTRGLRGMIAFCSFAMLIGGASFFVLTQAQIMMVDTVLGDVDGSLLAVTLMMLLGLIMQVGGFHFFELIKWKALNKIYGDMREDFLKVFYSRNYQDVQNKHSAELMTLMVDDITNVGFTTKYILTNFAYTAVLLVGSIAMMFAINWQMAIVVTATVPLMIFIFNRFSPSIEKTSKDFMEAEERVRKNMQEGFSNAFLFKPYFMLNKLAAKHKGLHDARGKARVKQAKVTSYQGRVHNIYNQALDYTVYVLGGFFVVRGVISVGEVLGILALRAILYLPLNEINGIMPMIAEARTSYNRVREVLDLPEEKLFEDVPIGQAARLVVEGLSFSYGDDYNDDNAVLRDVAFEFERGKIVGIKGESGSGKSTLLQVIMGFYRPQRGSVKLVDDMGLYTQNIARHIAYVPPAGYVFNASVAENICMTKDAEQAALEKAARGAGIYDFIMSLPDGFDSIIGEGATELSSGQGQRVAIARALYQDSAVLIFDEPTSNLDNDSIAAVHETIGRLAKDKICLIVSHDEKTMDICDEVYVLGD